MNTVLMEIYDEYIDNKTVTKLEGFTKKTFPQDGTDKLYMGCVLILVNSVYKTRVNAETLRSVVLSVKEKIGNTNLLKIYLERINGDKLISKYLFSVIDNKNIVQYANVILEYLDDMSFDFSKLIHNHYQDKIDEYN